MLRFEQVLSCGKDVVKLATHGVLEEEMYPSLSRLSKRTRVNVRTVGEVRMDVRRCGVGARLHVDYHRCFT